MMSVVIVKYGLRTYEIDKWSDSGEQKMKAGREADLLSKREQMHCFNHCTCSRLIISSVCHHSLPVCEERKSESEKRNGENTNS